MTAMYSTRWTWPVAIRLFLSNLAARTGYIFLDHLAADGAGFAGGQVTVVTVLQVHTDFLGSLHLATVYASRAYGWSLCICPMT